MSVLSSIVLFLCHTNLSKSLNIRLFKFISKSTFFTLYFIIWAVFYRYLFSHLFSHVSCSLLLLSYTLVSFLLLNLFSLCYFARNFSNSLNFFACLLLIFAFALIFFIYDPTTQHYLMRSATSVNGTHSIAFDSFDNSWVITRFSDNKTQICIDSQLIEKGEDQKCHVIIDKFDCSQYISNYFVLPPELNIFKFEKIDDIYCASYVWTSEITNNEYTYWLSWSPFSAKSGFLLKIENHNSGEVLNYHDHQRLGLKNEIFTRKFWCY
ncbi:hypothetical protein RCL1_000568 [Eukaryota sp. TZLM3-RCL]